MEIEQEKMKKRGIKILSQVMRYIFLITFGYLLLYPFFYILLNSFKSASDFYDPTVVWIPKHFVLDNLKAAYQALEFGRSFLSTLINGIIPAIIQFCTCAIFGYGLARFRFKGRSILFGAMFLNIMVPVTILIVPTYVNFQHVDFLGILGLISNFIGKDIRLSFIDTSLVFYIPALLGVGLKSALYICIYSQFFKNLPRELEEAAWIDGAGPWKTFVKIIAPSSGSAGITVLIFSVIWNWSDYYLPQIYFSDKYPLSVMLNRFRYSLGSIMAYYIEEANVAPKYVILAACLIFLIPLLIFYLIVQKKFIASIATTGLVG